MVDAGCGSGVAGVGSGLESSGRSLRESFGGGGTTG